MDRGKLQACGTAADGLQSHKGQVNKTARLWPLYKHLRRPLTAVSGPYATSVQWCQRNLCVSR